MRTQGRLPRLYLILAHVIGLVLACDLTTLAPTAETPSAIAPVQTTSPQAPYGEWLPPRTPAEWRSNPVRGAVVEIGYGGPNEYNDPPYPSVDSLRQLQSLGARTIGLEVQYLWSIEPPYGPDEEQFTLLTGALDNVAAAGLYAVVSVRNGPGRNAMMPDVADEEVITTLYVDQEAQRAYQEMLRDLVSRFGDRPEIIAWEPIVEPVPDVFLTQEEAPYPRAAAMWNELAPQLITAIRQVDPQRPILIEPVGWGGLDGFVLLDRFEDDNVVYCLHTYEPHTYTHQVDPPYTAYPRVFYDEYVDRSTLEAWLAPVDAFQEEHNVPIVVGEWGGIRWLPGIEEYISDQLSLFEARGWSWLWYAWDDEEWDQQGFGLHFGPDPNTMGYDPQAPAFRPLVEAWRTGVEAIPPLEEATVQPPGGTQSSTEARLAEVSHWLYLINVDLEPETVQRIVASEYDLVVLDFIPSEEDNREYPVADLVTRLHDAEHPKLVIAYIDIGQAENYRIYWQEGWEIGDPKWIVGEDPDGWEGNYPVAFWHDEWQGIWLGEDGILQQILDAGFDGVYLDWIEAYADENVIAIAEQDDVDPVEEMIWWVQSISDFLKSQCDECVVIAQNAADLTEYDDYVEAIDAIAQEQVWFDGGADNDPPGDCPLPRTNAEVETEAYRDSLSEPCRRYFDSDPESPLHVSSEEYLYYLTLAQRKGIFIFTVDYALDPENISWVYETSRALGFVPFVSNRALDRYVEPVP